MVRLVFIGLLCAFFLFFFPLEEKEDASPVAWKLTGVWVAEDSASIKLLGDGTCQVCHLDLDRLIPLEVSGKKTADLKGVWDYKSYFNRQLPYDLDDNKLLLIVKDSKSKKEYNLFFSIKGDSGILKNKEPWILYVSEGKWFEKNIYEFRRKME